MQPQRNAKVILGLLRRVLLIDVFVAAIVVAIAFLSGLRTLEAYSTILVWAGIGLMIFGGFTGLGGMFSRGEDAAALSLSGAGGMNTNLRQIAGNANSSLGCFVLLLAAGLGLVVIGYLVPFVAPLLVR